MIKCETTKNGVKTISSGSRITLMQELTNAIRTVRNGFIEKEGQKCADEDIRECIRISFLNKEDIEEESRRNKKEIMEKLGIDEEAFRKLVETL